MAVVESRPGWFVVLVCSGVVLWAGTAGAGQVADPAAGQGLVSVDVKGGDELRVYVDGEFVGITPVVAEKVAPGSHEVLVLSNSKDRKSRIEGIEVGAGLGDDLLLELGRVHGWGFVYGGIAMTLLGGLLGAISLAGHLGDSATMDADAVRGLAISAAVLAGVGVASIVGGGLFVARVLREQRALLDAYFDRYGRKSVAGPLAVGPVVGPGLGLVGVF